VDGSSRSARVRSLIPWTEYRFGVTAENSAGEGRMAAISGGEVCLTPPAAPRRSPLHVCTDSRRPRQLVIVWKVRTGCHALVMLQIVRLSSCVPRADGEQVTLSQARDRHNIFYSHFIDHFTARMHRFTS